MNERGQLIEYLDRTPLPWISYSREHDKFILVLDNHLMATYRGCPQHFMNMHVEGIRRKQRLVAGSARVWFLDFGVILHKALENYYTIYREPGFVAAQWAISIGTELWTKNDMDYHSEEKEYKTMGGREGFVGLLMQYVTVYNATAERIRVLGTEISFGKNREVLLGETEDFILYLAGRMDMIIDDGYFICPMDHKTKAAFKGDITLDYEMDEGPTGYIFALKTVLPQFLGENEILKRDCSKVLINAISKASTTVPADRFKRVSLRKTTYQLESYRQRMITTATHILNDMITYVSGSEVYRNAQVCSNWMRRPCTYFDICRQSSKEAENMTIQNGFVKTPIWDTETVNN
jgi:hypothetical protein